MASKPYFNISPGIKPVLSQNKNLKTSLIFSFQFSWKIVYNTIQYIIFQHVKELNLIQRILIRFEAILENYNLVYYLDGAAISFDFK